MGYDVPRNPDGIGLIKDGHHLRGKPGNNPTGKGLVHDGSQGIHSAPKKAAHELNRLLSEAILANDAKATKANLHALMAKYMQADEWATGFVWDRMVGRPAQTVAVGGTGEGGDPVRHIVEFVIVDPVTRST